ncbi:hypothetical protein HKX48_009088 [Thoreauomyces humboldtii]|nr:hypothetical protein HKX48_009088 [Thoreauomyces humboldtii]
MLGTLLVGLLYLLSNRRTPHDAPACTVMAALSTGFCGCLTTVSTWVVELTSLRKRDAWIYGLASVLTGLAILAVVLGPVVHADGAGACIG